MEKAASNWVYVACLGLFLLVCFRWGVTAVELFNHPRLVSAFSSGEASGVPGGELPWSAYTPMMWQDLTDWASGASGTNRGAEPLEATNRLVSLPWLGISIALFISMFGGLRYLGARLLPSALTAYAAVSLPIFDAHVSLGGYADIWLGLALLLFVLLLTIVLTYREWRVLVLLALVFIVLYTTQHAAVLVFLAIVPVMLLWRVIGGSNTLVLMLGVGVLAYSLSGSITQDAVKHLYQLMVDSGDIVLFSGNDTKTGLDQATSLMVDEWLVKDNWHLLWLSGCGSLLWGGGLMGLPRKRRRSQENRAFSLLTVAGVSLLLIVIGMTVLASQKHSLVAIAHFNRVTLYFAPVFCLILASIYHLMTRDDDTLPPI